MNTRKIRKAHALLAATVIGLPVVCSAASYTWDGSTTSGFGYFSEPDNWVGNVAPANNGTADLYFAATNTHGYSPTMSTTYNIDSINFNSGALAFNIAGSTLTLGAGGITDNATNAEQITSNVVQSASETWNIASGTLTLSGQLQNSAGGNLLTKSGSGTMVLSSLGSSSSIQALSIQGGATQITSGTLFLTATASNPFNVGAGSLTINGGATVDASAYTSQGGELIDGSTGPSVTVSGSGSQLKLGAYSSVGYTGSDTGSLTVQQNASVSGSELYVGAFLTSSGTLTVASGASVTEAQYVLLGLSAGTTGTATVTGSGSTLTANSEIYIGGATSTGGTGILYVENQGSVVTPTTEFSSNNASINANGGTLTTGSLISLSTGYGAITLTDPAGGQALTINGSSGTNNYAGSISGTGSLFKSGASTQILSGANTFTGLVFVTGGTLSMSSGAAYEYEVTGNSTLVLSFSPLGSSVVFNQIGSTVTFSGSTISGGYLEGPGTYNIAAVSTIAGTTVENGTTITPAAGASLSAVTNSGTINNPSGQILFWFGGSNAGGTLNVSGTTLISEWTSSGIVQVNPGGSLLPNTANMVLLGGSRTYLGTSSSPGGSITLTSGDTIELNGGLLVNYGTISGGTVDVNFGGLATGTGSYSSVNVNPGGTYSPGMYTAASVLPQSSTSYAAIQAAASGATTTGTAISVNATANITVNTGDHLTLTSPLTLNGNNVNKAGGGTSTVIPFTTPSLTVSAGTLQMSTSTSVLQVGTLSIAAGATLDLTNDDMIIHNGNLGTVTTPGSITSEIATGRGTNGLWTGPGITSSSAAATPSRTALAVELNSNGTPTGTLFSTFEGQPVTNTDVLVKYTFVGDADLSGTINAADYLLIDNGFNSAGAKTGWRNGDFNYDGLINGDDYTLIDNAYNTQGSVSFANTSAGPSEMIATDTAQITLSAAVPEPTSLSILGIISFSLVGRSSRQRLRR